MEQPVSGCAEISELDQRFLLFRALHTDSVIFLLPHMSFVAASDVFQLMADPTRRQLMELTAARERSVSELVDATGLSQPAVSKQLAMLREAGLVTVRKDGRKRLYHARTEELAEMRDWLLQYGPLWADRLDDLEAYLDEM